MHPPKLLPDNPALEGEEIRLEAQKISIVNTPKRMIGGITMFPVSARTSARAVLTKAYKPSTPRRFAADSALEHGASITGEKVHGYSGDILCMADVGVGGPARSASHKRQFLELTGGAFAVVFERKFTPPKFDVRTLLESR